MSKWQPLESAPHDKWLLVFDPNGVDYIEGEDNTPKKFHVFMAHWEEKEWIACFGEVDGWGCPSGGYDHWVAGLIVNPTHWMPLPEPPQTEEHSTP